MGGFRRVVFGCYGGCLFMVGGVFEFGRRRFRFDCFICYVYGVGD